MTFNLFVQQARPRDAFPVLISLLLLHAAPYNLARKCTSLRPINLIKNCCVQTRFDKLSMLAICSATKYQWREHCQPRRFWEKWEFLKNYFFTPKWCVFFSEYFKFSIFSQNNYLPETQSCTFHFLKGMRHSDMARKRGQTFKWLKVPRWFPIESEWSMEGTCRKMWVSWLKLKLSLWFIYSLESRHYLSCSNVNFLFWGKL